MSYAARKQRNKSQDLHPDRWAELFELYLKGHSITTCSTIFKISYGAITNKLKECGIEKPNKVIDAGKCRETRLTIIPKGRFADLYK